MGGMGTTAYPHRLRPTNHELPTFTTTSTGGCGGIDVNDPESFSDTKFWTKESERKGDVKREAMVVGSEGIRSRYFALVSERNVEVRERQRMGAPSWPWLTVGQGVVVVYHPPPSTTSKGRTYSAPSTTPFCQ